MLLDSLFPQITTEPAYEKSITTTPLHHGENIGIFEEKGYPTRLAAHPALSLSFPSSSLSIISCSWILMIHVSPAHGHSVINETVDVITI